jgi:hypothetical protein
MHQSEFLVCAFCEHPVEQPQEQVVQKMEIQDTGHFFIIGSTIYERGSCRQLVIMLTNFVITSESFNFSALFYICKMGIMG